MLQFAHTLFQRGQKLLYRDVYDIQEHLCERGKIAFVERVIAGVECFIVFADILLYRVGDTVADKIVKLLREKIAADKSACSSVSVIEWVDIPENGYS